MTRIVCRASDCIFWDEGACSAEEITYDPENGCLMYEGIEDALLEDDEEWEDDDLLDDDSIEWDDEEEDDLVDEDKDDEPQDDEEDEEWEA